MCKRRTQRERHELVEEWPAMGLKEVFWFYGLFRGVPQGFYNSAEGNTLLHANHTSFFKCAKDYIYTFKLF